MKYVLKFYLLSISMCQEVSMYLFGSVDPSRKHEGKFLWILTRPILANSPHNHIKHDLVSFRRKM